MLLSARLKLDAVALLAPLLLLGCGTPPNAAECAELLDRYVSLLATSDRPSVSEMELMKLRAEAREKAAKDPAFRSCPREVSRRMWSCAMQAPDVDRFEQCLL
jgi:hypothetical protein